MEHSNEGNFFFCRLRQLFPSNKPVNLWNVTPNTLFFSTQRYSKDLVFQLLRFSIHKPTLNPLKLHSIHTSHPATLKYQKGLIKGQALRLLRTNSVKENFWKTQTRSSADSVTEAILRRSFIKSLLNILYIDILYLIWSFFSFYSIVIFGWTLNLFIL